MGSLLLWSNHHSLIAVSWTDRAQQTERHLDQHLGIWSVQDAEKSPAAAALEAYLSGNLRALNGVMMNPIGTPFQQRVWAALTTIPVGETWSYKRLACAIGRPTAYRAVANANGRNPLPIFIPCHRVIAADGSLGGFSSGLDRKAWLLAHEQ